VIEELRAAVGAQHVLVDDDLRASYETDWTGRFSGRAVAVVRPADTAQVAAVVRAVTSAGASLTVQGGNTGLVGGSTPAGGEVLLSMTRLTRLDAVDRPAAQVTVGAGVTLAGLQEHAGLTATNAGGIRVLRYGSMRAQVMGAEAVLADGTVISRLGGLAKDNTGYDLVSLLCGSEGTLGVITALRLRLVPRLRARAVALVALDGTQAAVDVLPALRERLPDLTAAELFLAAGLALVRGHSGLPAPFPDEHPAYLVLECAGRTDPTDALVDALADIPGLRDATVATDVAGQRALWAYREQHTEAISAAGVPVKLDVSVPVAGLPELVDRLPGVIGSGRPVLFGHVNEGNLHVNVLDAADRGEEVTDAVLRLVAELGGSISSEHGVGRAKVPWLGLSRSREEIAAMRAVKNALDPQGMLNPGVLLP
jgi:FAD/FMN-containing dehydrogenase